MNDINPEEYTLVRLRAWLRNLNQPTSGNKAGLVLRLNGIPIEERGVCPIEDDIPDHNEENTEQEVDGTSSYISNEEHEVEETNDAVGDEELGIIERELRLLRRGMELVTRAKELLKKENEQLKKTAGTTLANSPVPSSKNEISVITLKDFLPEFDGNGDVNLWTSQLSNMSKLYKPAEDVLKALIFSKLKGKAQTWLHSKPDYITDRSETLLSNIRDAFKPPGGMLQQRRAFENRKWSWDEKFANYYNEKLTLANNLKMDEAEIVDHIIEGIADLQLRTQAKIQCFDSKEKLLRAFVSVELRRPYVRQSQTSSNDTTKSLQEIRCYNCNSLGHYANECSKSKREYGACFGCGEKTHHVVNCPERKKPATQDGNNEFVRTFKYSFNCNISFNIYVETLIDSGSPISLIRKSVVPPELNLNLNKLCKTQYFGINKSELSSYGKLSCVVECNNKECSITLLIVADESVGYDVVLGRDFLRASGSKLLLSYVEEFEKGDGEKRKKNTELTYVESNLSKKEHAITNKNENGTIKNNDYKISNDRLNKLIDSSSEEKIDGKEKEIPNDSHDMFDQNLMAICVEDDKPNIIVGNHVKFNVKEKLIEMFNKHSSLIDHKIRKSNAK